MVAMQAVLNARQEESCGLSATRYQAGAGQATPNDCLMQLSEVKNLGTDYGILRSSQGGDAADGGIGTADVMDGAVLKQRPVVASGIKAAGAAWLNPRAQPQLSLTLLSVFQITTPSYLQPAHRT